MADEAHRRYAEIMRDIELMIDDDSKFQPLDSDTVCVYHALLHPANQNQPVSKQGQDIGFPSKLRMLVPTAGPFFTRLPLEAAFKYQDRKRYISSRRYVAPSFNDVRQVLNSAQVMAVTGGTLQLATFDGDVTLYDDGQCLEPDSPVVSRLLGAYPPTCR